MQRKWKILLGGMGALALGGGVGVATVACANTVNGAQSLVNTIGAGTTVTLTGVAKIPAVPGILQNATIYKQVNTAFQNYLVAKGVPLATGARATDYAVDATGAQVQGGNLLVNVMYTPPTPNNGTSTVVKSTGQLTLSGFAANPMVQIANNLINQLAPNGSLELDLGDVTLTAGTLKTNEAKISAAFQAYLTANANASDDWQGISYTLDYAAAKVQDRELILPINAAGIVNPTSPMAAVIGSLKIAATPSSNTVTLTGFADQ